MRNLKHLIYIGIIFNFNIHIVNPQEIDSSETDYVKLSVLAGISAGGFIYAYGIENNMWWKGEKSKFHSNFRQDWKYALGSDKFGHFYFGHLIATVYSDAYKWCGLEDDKSRIYGGITALSYQTFIEIRDGFSKEYGFSWGDFTANSIGSFMPYLRAKIPELEIIRFKISYFPSQRFKDGNNQYIIDDYESTYNWISFEIKQWLPENWQKYYPSFLNLAIGHSVKNLGLPEGGNHEIYLGFDWNIEKLPVEGSFIDFIKKYLNLYHFPAPAIKIYPDVVWYGLKF